MSLFSTISTSFGVKEEALLTSYRYIVVGGKYAFFEGMKSIKVLEKDEITFIVNAKLTLTIKGEDLVLKKFEGGDGIVFGEINSVIKGV